jgi:predicted nucleotidyltransferase
MKTEISNIVNELKKIKKVVAIILFGSYAKKRATPISDVDICVVTKKANEKVKSNIVALGNEKIQIVLWDELHLPIKFRVLKEGKFLFVRDESSVSSLKAETISRFLDFKPILDSYYKKVYGWKYEI